jgi:hypothetical protein
VTIIKSSTGLQVGGAVRFTLHYRGSLRANGRPSHKHAMRKHFHQQLRELYNQPPLDGHWQTQWQPGSPLRNTAGRQLGSFEFLPVVYSEWYLGAGLEITLLRPEAPGKIITQSGDIDNRLKTLLDSLKIPDAGSLPPGASPDPSESPFLCLLQDDNLITELKVVTDRLLDPSAISASEVVLLINVQIKVLRSAGGLGNTIYLGD